MCFSSFFYGKINFYRNEESFVPTNNSSKGVSKNKHLELFGMVLQEKIFVVFIFVFTTFVPAQCITEIKIFLVFNFLFSKFTVNVRFLSFKSNFIVKSKTQKPFFKSLASDARGSENVYHVSLDY